MFAQVHSPSDVLVLAQQPPAFTLLLLVLISSNLEPTCGVCVSSTWVGSAVADNRLAFCDCSPVIGTAPPNGGSSSGGKANGGSVSVGVVATGVAVSTCCTGILGRVGTLIGDLIIPLFGHLAHTSGRSARKYSQVNGAMSLSSK